MITRQLEEFRSHYQLLCLGPALSRGCSATSFPKGDGEAPSQGLLPAQPPPRRAEILCSWFLPGQVSPVKTMPFGLSLPNTIGCRTNSHNSYLISLVWEMLVVSEAFNCQRLECSDPSLVFLQMLKLRHKNISETEVLPTVSQNRVWRLLSWRYCWFSSVIMEMRGVYVWWGGRQDPGCGAGHCPTALGVLLFLGCGTSHRGEATPGLTSERL